MSFIGRWIEDFLLQLYVQERLKARAEREGRTVEEILREESKR